MTGSVQENKSEHTKRLKNECFLIFCLVDVKKRSFLISCAFWLVFVCCSSVAVVVVVVVCAPLLELGQSLGSLSRVARQRPSRLTAKVAETKTKHKQNKYLSIYPSKSSKWVNFFLDSVMTYYIKYVEIKIKVINQSRMDKISWCTSYPISSNQPRKKILVSKECPLYSRESETARCVTFIRKQTSYLCNWVQWHFELIKDLNADNSETAA